MDSYSYMIYVGYVWLCINIYIYIYISIWIYDGYKFLVG